MIDSSEPACRHAKSIINYPLSMHRAPLLPLGKPYEFTGNRLTVKTPVPIIFVSCQGCGPCPDRQPPQIENGIRSRGPVCSQGPAPDFRRGYTTKKWHLKGWHGQTRLTVAVPPGPMAWKDTLKLRLGVPSRGPGPTLPQSCRTPFRWQPQGILYDASAPCQKKELSGWQSQEPALSEVEWAGGLGDGRRRDSVLSGEEK
jgi:hypothetical protein